MVLAASPGRHRPRIQRDKERWLPSLPSCEGKGGKGAGDLLSFCLSKGPRKEEDTSLSCPEEKKEKKKEGRRDLSTRFTGRKGILHSREKKINVLASVPPLPILANNGEEKRKDGAREALRKRGGGKGKKKRGTRVLAVFLERDEEKKRRRPGSALPWRA